MTVFGIVADIPFIIGHCVMLGLLVILILLEYAVEYLDIKAEQYSITLLLEKLKKELMFMGIISFVVFVYGLISHPTEGDSVFSAFEMSHMVFFFMAIAFLFQALFLTSYSTTIGRTFIMALRTNVKDLLQQYDKMNPRESWWFHHGTALLPFLAPSFRTTIEFRIVERLFIHQHKLSPEFQFAHYVNRLFGLYIAELGNVTPMSWCILMILVCVNFLRAGVIDSTDSINYADGCPHILASDIASAGFVPTVNAFHRFLESNLGTKVELDDVPDSCKTYVIIYTYVCASLLFLYALFIYGITIMYMERIIKLSLTTDGIAAKGNENMRASYKESLTLMDHRERLLKLGAEMRNLGKVKSEKMMISERSDHDKSTSKTNKTKKNTRSGSFNDRGVQKGGLFGHSAQLKVEEEIPIDDMIKPKPARTRRRSLSERSAPLNSNEPLTPMDFKQKIAMTDTHEDDKGEGKSSVRLAYTPASQTSTTADSMNVGGHNGGHSLIKPSHESHHDDVHTFDADVFDNKSDAGCADVGGGSPSPATSNSIVRQDTYTPQGKTWEGHKGGALNDGRYYDGDGDTKQDEVHAPPLVALQRQSSVIIESIMAEGDTEVDNNLNSIFLFGSPAAYFKAVEAILLVQCFYISIAATQMIPMINNGGWILALIIPVPCILYILQMVLTKAVLLRAVYELNREVASQVVEDTIEEGLAKKKLQTAVFEVMDKKNIAPEIRAEFLSTFFFRYDKKKEGLVRKNDFFRLLQNDLHIMISSETFKILWTAIDQDLSGGLDVDEVLQLFDMQNKESSKEPVAVKELRDNLRELLVRKQLPLIEWEGYIHNVFKRYDGDGSGEIDRSEFFLMLQSLDIHVPEDQQDELLLAVDTEGTGSICFDEFFNVFFAS